MTLIDLRGEKHIHELVDRIVGRHSDDERRNDVASALLRENPRLDNIATLPPGTIVFVPPEVDVPPQVDSFAVLLSSAARSLSPSLDVLRRSVQSAGEAEIAEAQTTAELLRRPEVLKSLAGAGIFDERSLADLGKTVESAPEVVKERLGSVDESLSAVQTEAAEFLKSVGLNTGTQR